MINELIQGNEIDKTLSNCLYEIHTKGPTSTSTFEKLAYIKKFHPDNFFRFENKILSSLGLFYKVNEPKSVLEEFYSIYAGAIQDEYGASFTATQASAYGKIRDNKYFSFSSPTSSGKSYLFREVLQSTKNDVLIVLPSRALIAEYYNEVVETVGKDTLVLQFIENINISKSTRKVFIVTPERASEVIKYKDVFNFELVLFDEAQISEEELRGLRFDALVRRVDNHFPDAKKVFAHPFVDNPEAQLSKHNFSFNSSAKSYNLHTVGKIFISVSPERKFEYFSPYFTNERFDVGHEIVKDIIKENGTLLVYISKGKIYESRHLVDFGSYIDLCKTVTNPKAIELINNLKSFLGASSKPLNDKYSLLIDLMSKGIVIHHGSMPLKARLMAEDFIRRGYAKLCFATSTLAQGINMPFDVVWIDNFNNMTPITLKNLIGRSGRTTQAKGSFDFGYTIVKTQNIETFTSRINDQIEINPKSSLDDEINNIPVDSRDLAESILNNTFDDNLHLPESQIERIREGNLSKDIKYVLDKLMSNGTTITGSEYYELSNSQRKTVKTKLKSIYAKHLRRKKMEKSESAVLSTAIPILLWHVQGRSFSEIVSLRYNFLCHKDEQRKILARAKRKEITYEYAKNLIENMTVRFSPIAAQIPNSKLRQAPLVPEGTSVNNLSYDLVIFDTYDYLDKVISLSICDPLCAALSVYFDETKDTRAIAFQNYLRYGTNDDTEIWLIKYGFSFEDIDWLKDHIDVIDEQCIVFKDSLWGLGDDFLKVVERYL
ncbi:DEAD/DEAH box helicase [Vibrio alginolyticus]|nr:DEAD/DEAH box helicase [Vibrio alginolyticus]